MHAVFGEAMKKTTKAGMTVKAMKKPKSEMRRYNVEFLGKVFVRGVVTVTAIDHQGAERVRRRVRPENQGSGETVIASGEQLGADAWRFDGLTRTQCLAILARAFGMKATKWTHLSHRPGGPWWLSDCVTLEGQKRTSHCFIRGNGLFTELEALQLFINLYAPEFDRARMKLENEAQVEAAREARTQEGTT